MTQYAFSGGIKQHLTRAVDGNNEFSVSATFDETPTSGNLLVAIYAAQDYGDNDAMVFTQTPAGFTEQVRSDVAGVASAVGIATKTSDGTESGAFSITTLYGSFQALTLIELEADWEFDVAAADHSDTGPVSATTAALTAGEHLSIEAAVFDSSRGVLDASTWDRHLVDTINQGGVISVGVADLGTPTTAATFSADSPGGSYMAIAGAVFVKPSGGGPPPVAPLTVHGGTLTVSGSGTLSIMTGAGLVAV